MAGFRLRDVTEQRRFAVTGAPELTNDDGTVQIFPDLVIATFVDSRFTGAVVSGYTVREDGSRGEATREVYISGSGAIPEWLAPITDHRVRGLVVNAADLPLGSIVAGMDAVFIKRNNPSEPTMPWYGGPDGTYMNEYSSAEIDDMVQRGDASVLRVGSGA